jgi:integrase
MNWVEPIKNRDKIARIKDNLRKKPRDYLLFVLGINVALRASDLLSLTIGHIIEFEGYPREQITVLESKRKKRRVISLSDSAKEAIDLYMDSLGDWEIDMKAPVFYSQKDNNRAISRTQAYRLIKKWCADVELTGNYGTHSLRKTWAYWARKEGTAIDLIRQALGHSREETTLRYVGISRDEIDEVFRKVNL